MMINKQNGKLRINGNLTLQPFYTFDDFMKTPCYNNQKKERMIFLEDEQIIEGHKFYIRFFFKNNIIYSVLLTFADTTISEKNEPERKKIHDKILVAEGIEIGKEYSWGKVLSEYDPKSNSSDILVIYNQK